MKNEKNHSIVAIAMAIVIGINLLFASYFYLFVFAGKLSTLKGIVIAVIANILAIWCFAVVLKRINSMFSKDVFSTLAERVSSIEEPSSVTIEEQPEVNSSQEIKKPLPNPHEECKKANLVKEDFKKDRDFLATFGVSVSMYDYNNDGIREGVKNLAQQCRDNTFLAIKLKELLAGKVLSFKNLSYYQESDIDFYPDSILMPIQHWSDLNKLVDYFSQTSNE